MRASRNMPEIRMGVVGVSRDCFPMDLARQRLKKLVAACRKLKLNIEPCDIIIESESDAMAAAAEMRKKGVNAVAIYLGNFGPEGPTTIFAREFGGPFMLCGAAEESKKTLGNGRGDAFCGMLNASLNAGLRGLIPHIPESPIGLPGKVAADIKHFFAVACVMVGLAGLKVFAFGPRPHDFYACNAPIKPLYDLGIEVMENSELDLLLLYKSVSRRKSAIAAVTRDMARELGKGNCHPEKLAQLAQYEIALETFLEENLGSRQYGIFANKCWPSFEPAFGFVPCFVNSRLAARGIPVACEVDMYGGVSEYMALLATDNPVTILDVNNTVPSDIKIANSKGVARKDMFMGFHCGNTPSCCLCPGYKMKHQLIMHRLMEPGRDPDITCGTLEGTLQHGPTTLFRLQGAADCALRSYIAEGHILKANPSSFGGIGIIAIKEFSRFYRHVMLEGQFPHHAATAFKHGGKALYDSLKMMGVTEVHTPRPAGNLYPSENPFA